MFNFVLSITILFFLCCKCAVSSGLQTWQLIDDFHATSVGGVYATSEDVCYAAYTDNFDGPGEWLSKDAGETFSQSLGGWLNTDVAHDSTGNGIISTIGKTFSSINGEITAVPGRAITFSQNVENIGEGKFAVVGTHFTDGVLSLDSEFKNGPAITTDSGATWEYYDTGLDGQTFVARYGAFPSDTTWYISQGSWLSIDASNQKMFDLNRNETNWKDAGRTWNINAYASVNKLSSKKLKVQFKNNFAEKEYNFGAISKTTDGGKTFTKIYDSQGKYYMNQIDCSSTEICTVVAESSEKGIAMRTENGGKTWTQVFETPQSNTDVSLIGCRMLSDNEIWISGGTFQGGVVGWFFHSTDGGKTWNQTDLRKGYAIDMSFSGNKGYATAMSELGSTISVYK